MLKKEVFSTFSRFICSIYFLELFYIASSLELRAHFSEQGLHGTITFTQRFKNDPVVISTNLDVTLEYPDQVWSMSVTEFPTDYTIIDNSRCSSNHLGKVIFSLEEAFGYLILPENNTVTIEVDNLAISGDKGLYGKSLLLRNIENGKVTCASLTLKDKTQEKTAIARYNSPISGDVYFRWFFAKDGRKEMLIMTDLYRVTNVEMINASLVDFTEHKWKIYVTDILDFDHDKSETNCNILQLVFDADNRGDGNSVGDIDDRVGKLKISTDYTKRQYKTLFRDDVLNLLPGDLAGPQRRLYLVIFGSKHSDTFLTCSRIRYENPINARVSIQSGGIKGDVTLTQHSRFESTFLNFNLSTARGDVETKLVYSTSVAGYKIHELPQNPPKTIGQTGNICLTTKFVYNPNSVEMEKVPPKGFGTQEQYAVGDLSGKLFGRNNFTEIIPGSQELNGIYFDVFLPLQGKYSVIHRSLVIYKNTQYLSASSPTTEPWICGDISLYDAQFRYQIPLITAEVVFRYPLVGRIVLRQPRDEHWTDTSMLVEYLVHADGSQLNSTEGHRWAVTDKITGKDFYNWTARCVSAGPVYNPYKVDNQSTPASSNSWCSMNTVGLCHVGDLSTRHGSLKVAGKISESDRVSRILITDGALPLSGYHKIIGRSFVMYDDHGPVARGERLACSTIGAVYRRKAVVRDWFPNGDELTIKGKIEFYQQTEYDITNVEVDLQGLVDNSGYHVHITPVEENLEFPCEGSSLYDHWNPLNVDPSSSPRSYLGTSDQYEMGDLSGKFGTLDNQTIYSGLFNDSMLPLFGPRSILGRSVIVHKKDKNKRWACSSIERGYSPSEARERRAIVSFHNPNGFAFGYMRFTQLIYNDGSQSDTVIEVKLRHPGKHDRNITRDHDWSIFVNPVGVDATVKTTGTRCVAGGYVWNPYYTQLADPLNEDLYRQECGAENPLRCHAGDLSARLGTIDIGLKRVVYTDSNLPLEGPINAMGRSIVIKGPNRGSEKYACANIEEDHDLVKYVNIQRPPRFVLAQFIEDVRMVMGVPEWFLTVDSRRTRTLHSGACVQLQLRFKGPLATRMEQDFSKLMSTGKLEAPSLSILGYIDEKRKSKLSYRICGVRDPNEKEDKNRRGRFSFITTSSVARLTTSSFVLSLRDRKSVV